MTYNMKEHKEKGVDLGLQTIYKSLGYVAGGTALLGDHSPGLLPVPPKKAKRDQA